MILDLDKPEFQGYVNKTAYNTPPKLEIIGNGRLLTESPEDPLAELKQSIDKLEQSVAANTAAVNEFIRGKL